MASASKLTIRICATYGCGLECEMGSSFCAKCEERYAEARAEIADQRSAEQEFRDYHDGGCFR